MIGEKIASGSVAILVLEDNDGWLLTVGIEAITMH